MITVNDIIPIESISNITLTMGESSSCCDGIFEYTPVILDFGGNINGRNSVINSKPDVLYISTNNNQVLYLLGIKDIIMMEDAKLSIKFANISLL